MLLALALSTVMAVLTVGIHMTGLAALLALMRHRAIRLHAQAGRIAQGIGLLGVVLGLFVVHGVEIWLYAALYVALDAFSDLETALYFSTSTFTTLGYGDIVIASQWRLVAALEGFAGFMMIGWSTAFLVSVVGRLRQLELGFLDHGEEEADAPR